MGVPHLTYLSLGAGVQSSALLVMGCRGLRGVPRPDVAIFADTMAEPQYVYDYLQLLRCVAFDAGVEIVQVSKGNLGDDIVQAIAGTRSRFASIPAFTTGKNGKAAMTRRQYTREYKIEPIMQEARRRVGLAYRQPAIVRRKVEGVWQKIHRVTATAMIGISLDEWYRARTHPKHATWVTNTYPLLDLRMTRQDCLDLLKAEGIPEPRKSACIFCPFHDDGYWLWLKTDHPEEFEKACVWDEKFRDQSTKGMDRPIFLHRSLQPLRLVDFNPKNPQMLLWPAQTTKKCSVTEECAPV